MSEPVRVADVLAAPGLATFAPGSVSVPGSATVPLRHMQGCTLADDHPGRCVGENLFPAVARRYIKRPYVPAKHAAATLDTFDTAIAGPKYVSELATAKRLASRFVAAALERRPAMLAIIGTTGNGKSHLLYAVANALAAHEAPVFCRPWYRLADELRYGGPLPWAPDGATVEPDALRRALYGSPIVLLDEVRGTAGTDFDGNELAKVSCHAYDEGRALLITSNVHPLTEIMGAAPADRFAVAHITAPSRRQVL